LIKWLPFVQENVHLRLDPGPNLLSGAYMKRDLGVAAKQFVIRPANLALTHFWYSCLRGADDARLVQIDFCTPVRKRLAVTLLRLA